MIIKKRVYKKDLSISYKMKGFVIQQVGIYKLKPAIEPKSMALLGTFFGHCTFFVDLHHYTCYYLFLLSIL